MEHWSTAVMAIRAQELFFSFNPSLHDSLAQTWLAGPQFRRYPSEILQRQQRIQGQSRLPIPSRSRDGEGRPELPGPDLVCRARVQQVPLPKYCTNSSLFRPSRSRAGQLGRSPEFSFLILIFGGLVVTVHFSGTCPRGQSGNAKPSILFHLEAQGV